MNGDARRGASISICQMERVRKSSLADDAYDGGALRLTNFTSISRRVEDGLMGVTFCALVLCHTVWLVEWIL